MLATSQRQKKWKIVSNCCGLLRICMYLKSEFFFTYYLKWRQTIHADENINLCKTIRGIFLETKNEEKATKQSHYLLQLSMKRSKHVRNFKVGTVIPRGVNCRGETQSKFDGRWFFRLATVYIFWEGDKIWKKIPVSF